MQRDRTLQIRILRALQNGEKEGFDGIPKEVLGYNSALLIDEGLAVGEKMQLLDPPHLDADVWDLTVRGHDFLERLDSQFNFEAIHPPKVVNMTETKMTVFISHASADQALAAALARLLRSAFNLPTNEIRCTSVDEFRLPAGADTNDQLRREVRESKVFVGIITPSSIQSAYVLFELGARWGAQMSLFPVLARGAGSQHLKGPLNGINALNLTNPQLVKRLLEDIADKANLSLERQSTLDTEVSKVVAEAEKVEQEGQPLPPTKKPLGKESQKVLVHLFKFSHGQSVEGISRGLSMPLNVSKYHRDQLLQAGLVEEGMDEDLFPIYSLSVSGRAWVVEHGPNGF
ncbi:TIR domain-containing protein [Luteolibacter sp. Populi]|uniref:TIR domain-containing protein n=1 Tax=Luteolibacter sp. Populi TaxID=3230487 RepID=UPI003466084F